MAIPASSYAGANLRGLKFTGAQAINAGSQADLGPVSPS